AFEPELIICMGNHAIKYITGEKNLLDAISNNGKISVMVSGKKIPVISITHPSDANGAKHNPSYKYEETIKLIHDTLSDYLGLTPQSQKNEETINTKTEDERIQSDKSIEICERLGYSGEVTHPPALRKTTMGHLDINDPFFDKLKKEYPEFEEWFKSKSDRGCFVHFRDNGIIGALLILKEENSEIDSIPILRAKKRLKISTFYVERWGHKIGELFIKLAIEYAIKNDIDELYLTHFVEKNDHLIDLLVRYGFHQAGLLNKTSETIFHKEMIVNINETETLNPLEISEKYYPSFKDGHSIRKFVVPIIPEFHQRLFTEYKSRQTAIYEHTSEFVVEGNTIQKAYFSYSKIKQIRPGDILLFYRSKNKRSGSRDQGVITSLGVVEKSNNVTDMEETIRSIKNRTVYTPDEIKERIDKEAMLILFMWHFHFLNPLKLKDLMEMEVLKAPPQSITQIDHEKYIIVKKRGGIDERFTID
ncbi:MAG TPA: GNAT family N-acetyltransferase, partial [Bacteroidales bacterium]|nr:GNAT family N-acetyltransferase [Bacteroidales bacterium]